MDKNLIAQIENYLTMLRLQTIKANYQDISDKASKSNLQYEEYLALLLEMEVKRKQETSIQRRTASAKFPFIKTMEEFDFSFQPGLNEKELIKLGGLGFIDEKENIIFLGSPGVGKSHLAIGLGIKACMARLRVEFTTAQDLLRNLSLAQKEGCLIDKLLYYSRLHLLIIDELGYMPINNEEANLLFQLVSIRYEKGSIIITSNFNFDEWNKLFQETVIASAIIDRLVHHSHIFFINGSSYRLKNKLKKAS